MCGPLVLNGLMSQTDNGGSPFTVPRGNVGSVFISRGLVNCDCDISR